MAQSEEQRRLEQAREESVPWKKWGPYLSERQWGTVREDDSADGNPWNYFTHDQARSRAYRWGEDGFAGISDDHQVVFRRGDVEREGSDSQRATVRVDGVLLLPDSTPAHSYMKYLYKYPQVAYPYDDLVKTNRERGRGAPSMSSWTQASSTKTVTSMYSWSTQRPALRTSKLR
jgi:hypothetical protein